MLIEIQLHPKKGRIVIARNDIAQGELIEAAPVAPFPPIDRSIINNTCLFEYYFVKPDEYIKSREVKGYFVFGFASICSHAVIPNAYVEWMESETGSWAHLIALRNIRAGEEVTLYYTNIDEYDSAQEFV